MLILAISLVCVLGTQTRSAWAVVALLVFLYGVFQEKKYVGYLVIACSCAFFVPSIQDRILDLFQGNDPDAFLENYERLNSYAWRKIIWTSAIEQYWDRPIFGFGYESFQTYSGNFFLIASDNEYGLGSHNTYVQLLFELGIVGILSFFYLLGTIGYKLWNYRIIAGENIVPFGLFIGYCLVHYSDNVFDYLVFNWYFWFFIGAFLAFSRLRVSAGHHQAKQI